MRWIMILAVLFSVALFFGMNLWASAPVGDFPELKVEVVQDTDLATVIEAAAPIPNPYTLVPARSEFSKLYRIPDPVGALYGIPELQLIFGIPEQSTRFGIPDDNSPILNPKSAMVFVRSPKVNKTFGEELR